LNSSIRQFEFVDAKILGVIFNCTLEGSGSYGKKYYRRYYRRYYKRYYKSYYHKKVGNYESSARKPVAQEEK